ncbi:MAG: DUF885 domain-containing protein [Myxococcales bacterium]|nr:DUF885 domain-containing protein [Myxococcales bacterium]
MHTVIETTTRAYWWSVLLLACFLSACATTRTSTDLDVGDKIVDTSSSASARNSITKTTTLVSARDSTISPAASDPFVVWLDEQYEIEIQTSPIQMTFLGRDDKKDQLDDWSVYAFDKQLALKAKSVKEMRARFNYQNLRPEQQIAYDLWVFQYEIMKAERPFINDAFFFNQMSGLHSFLATFMINFHRVETANDVISYIKRLLQFPRVFDQLLHRATIGATERGIQTPRFALEGTIKQSKAIITGQPFSPGKDSDLWADIKTEIRKLEKAKTIPPQESKVLLQAAEEALLTAVLPSYNKIIAWAKSMLKTAPATATGVVNQPNGTDYYAFRLRQQTTTDKSPEEIHQIGLKEVARIRKEMIGIMKSVGFSGTLPEFFEHIRTAEWNYYPNTDEGRAAYIADAAKAIHQIELNLPDYFGTLPKAKLIVKRVEAFRERDGAAQHYYPATPDGSRPGIYYAHLSDMTAMPKNQLEVIAYHEGIPGHHMQTSIAQELQTVPQFQTQASFAAYAEGWALYSEALAKELPGTYADPYSDFGRLTTEIWRAIRLVVDSGLHAKGWTEEQAIAYFKANSPEPLESIISEVQRYIVMPGQATSYKIGMLTIQSLRKYASQTLGEHFELKDFHDQILGSGSLPLGLLERKIHQWVASKSAKTAAPN